LPILKSIHKHIFENLIQLLGSFSIVLLLTFYRSQYRQFHTTYQQQQNCRSSQLFSKILPKTAGNPNPTSHDAFFRLTKNHETRDDTKKLNVYPLNLTQKVCHEQRVKVSKVQQSQMWRLASHNHVINLPYYFQNIALTSCYKQI